MTIGYATYCSDNAKNGPRMYLHDGLFVFMMNTLMRNRPTLSMKKVSLGRNFMIDNKKMIPTVMMMTL